MGLERGKQHLIHISDVAGAHGKDHIPMVGSHGHHPGGKTHVFNRLNPLAGSRILDAGSSIHDGGRGNLREVLLLLTGRENAGDDDIIGLGQRLGEFARKRTWYGRTDEVGKSREWSTADNGAVLHPAEPRSP